MAFDGQTEINSLPSNLPITKNPWTIILLFRAMSERFYDRKFRVSHASIEVMCLKELIIGETISPAGMAATSRLTMLYKAVKIRVYTSTVV